MTFLHQFEKSDRATRQQRARIRSMIEDLRRGVALLDADIEAVVAFERRVDPNGIGYPIAARTMKVRRNNLIKTISLLEAKLGALPDVEVELGSHPTEFSPELGKTEDKPA